MVAKQSNSAPTVIVTGASGLIGSRICRELRDAYYVVGLDVDRPKESGPDVWIECDLTDDASVMAALERVEESGGREVASVIHLAAYYDFTGEPSPLYDELTVEGTRRLLRGLRRFQVRQFVFSSSLLVLRPVQVGQELDEASPIEASWEYPQSKVDAERVIREERGDVPAVILRIAGVYDEDGHSIPIAQQIARIHGKTLESFFFPGNAEHGQAFIHLDDLTRCFRAVVERRDILGDNEIFLIGEPETLSYRDLQDILGELIHGREWPTIRIPKPIAKAGAWLKDKATPGDDEFIKPWMIDLADAHRPISIDRASRKLGWQPRHTLRDTLPEIVRRLQLDPAAWYEENGLKLPKSLERAS